MEEIFTKIYETNEWGTNNNSEYSGSSGKGSSLEYNKKYIKILQSLIKEYKINNIVDLGCGDFRIGRALYDCLNINYTGYDTYKKVVEYNKKQHTDSKYTFEHLDFYANKENIQSGDLCILKDVLQHWKNEEIYLFLDYLTKSEKFKYILIVNCCDQKKNKQELDPTVHGRWRKLNSSMLPLKKYKPVRIAKYNKKEIAIIKL